jgi:ankyrin repeat protein
LHFAAQSLHADIAEALLAAGADVDARNGYGNTPLWVAVFSSRDSPGEIVRVLLAAGADPDLKNNHDVSPWTLAQRVGNYDLKGFFAGNTIG